ncbi:MAG: hypothetical protein EOP64_05455 [Sphingomonas sp.]|nr:MAG: hypothetical protein EOP64_05455 [Sphingomonas sp.]
MASSRMARVGRIVAVTLALLAVGLVIAIALLFPWGPISGLTVENVRRTTAPPRIVVIFSTPTPIEAILKRKRAGFIRAALSDCHSGDTLTSEVAAQRAGYLRDDGRVRRRPGPSSPASYVAIFDDVTDRQGQLCFSLDGEEGPGRRRTRPSSRR